MTGAPDSPSADIKASVLIVGGGLAAARTCEELRRQGHTGPITMVSAESSRPYDRPPLSKDALLYGAQDVKPFKIDYDAIGVSLRLGHSVSAVDLANRVVSATCGDLSYDKLVIATGASPLRVPGPGEQLVLRTLADAEILRHRLVPGARIVIIGASWIGAEVATMALMRGCHVTVIEAGPAPLAQALGADIGALTLPWWGEIDLRVDSKVAAAEVGHVVLTDGERIPADAVLTGIGVQPDVAWLNDTDLELDRGVITDEALRTNVAGVVAVGDVAAWWSARYGTRMNIQHWDDASRGATVAAASIIHGSQSTVTHNPVPYFWSDQFGHKMQYLGHHDAQCVSIVRQVADQPGWSVCWYDADHRLSAVLCVDRVKEVAKARRLIADGSTIDVDRLGDPSLELTGCIA